MFAVFPEFLGAGNNVRAAERQVGLCPQCWTLFCKLAPAFD